MLLLLLLLLLALLLLLVEAKPMPPLLCRVLPRSRRLLLLKPGSAVPDAAKSAAVAWADGAAIVC